VFILIDTLCTEEIYTAQIEHLEKRSGERNMDSRVKVQLEGDGDGSAD